MTKTKSKLLKAVLILGILGLLGLVLVFGINGWVKYAVSDRVLTSEEAGKLPDVDCILVLGCRTGSDMLNDRLTRGVALYRQGAAPKLLVSGDHGTADYDEVYAMKAFAIEQGIPSEDVFMDHAGFSTYESIYRAKEIFGAERILIVTQEYHLYRALYIAEKLGVEAWGVSADYREYAGQTGRDIREILARFKDFGMCILKPEPTYLGETIPISGNGDVTHDEKTFTQ